MADRDYDRNRYRRIYDDDEQYGSGRTYSSGRDTNYGDDYRSRYGREGSRQSSGYRGMTGRGSRSGYEGNYSREGNYGESSYNQSRGGYSSGASRGREDYGRNYSSDYGRNYGRNNSSDYDRAYERESNYNRSFGETDDYNYGYGGEGYAGSSYAYGRGFSSSPTGSRTSRQEDRGYGYNYNQGYGPRSNESFDRYSGREGEENRRGFFDRAADEVKSWFGDEEAERRRQMDERYNETWGGYGGYSEGRGMYGTFTGRGPKSYRRSDERIQEDVNERLMQHPDIDASDIDVSVSDGIVTLTGTVDKRRTKHLAEDVAESVSGVKDVTNNIRVNQSWNSQSQFSTDTTSGLTGTSSQTGASGTTASTPQSGTQNRSKSTTS